MTTHVRLHVAQRVVHDCQLGRAPRDCGYAGPRGELRAFHAGHLTEEVS
jgi:hypothetical protein